MGNSIACFFFTLVVPSFALPFTIRSVINDRDRDDISSGVVMGIVVGILVLITIPLLWYVYRMCTRRRPTSIPLFVAPPRMFTNTTPNNNNSNLPPFSRSGNIARPQKAHTKINAPAFGA